MSNQKGRPKGGLASEDSRNGSAAAYPAPKGTGGQHFTIQGRLMGLNEYTAANRRNRHTGNRAKRENQDIVQWAIKAARLRPVKRPVRIWCLWLEKDKRRDPDNVAFAIKMILDALVEEKILQGDGWAHVVGIEHWFEVDKRNPRIVVEVVEV